MDPVALALLERYPLPTAAGTANNYSRTANEINDQDQSDVRLDHKFASGRDQVFGRLTHFRDTAVPVTALPDGSGTIPAGSVGHRTAEDACLGVRLELSTHLLEQPPERSPDRRHAPLG